MCEGGASQNIVLLIFQPTHFIVYIYHDRFEKLRQKKTEQFPPPALVAILDFMALAKVHIYTL